MEDAELTLTDAIQCYIPEGVDSALTPANVAFVRKTAGDLVVTNPDAFNMAAESVQLLKQMKKNADEQRRAENEDYIKKVSENNARYKPYTNEIDSLLKIIDGKMGEYTRREIERQQAEARKVEEERRRAEVEAAEIAARTAPTPVESLPWDLPVEPAPVAIIIPKPKPVEKPTAATTQGAIGMRENWKCEVADVDAMPNFVMNPKTGQKVFLFHVDLVALGEVVRAGVHEIPGVKIWADYSSTKVRG